MKTLIKIQVFCLALIANLSIMNAQISCSIDMWPNVVITCDDAMSRTFTINCFPQSTSLRYEWHVGSGWYNTAGLPVSGVIVTYSPFLTLIPSSNLSILSTISVDVRTHHSLLVAFSTVAVPINRSIGDITIIGNDELCSGSAVYSINSLLNNQSVSWSVSDPTKASLSNAGGTQVTVNKLADGQFDLIATVTNTCGASKISKFTINRSSPLITPAKVIGSSSICSGSGIYTMTGLQSGETVTWTVSNPNKATINPLGNNVVLTKTGDGEVILMGRVINQCGRIAFKSMTIGLGVPTVVTPHCDGSSITPVGQLPDLSHCDMCLSSYLRVSQNLIEGQATGGNALTWEWEKITNNFGWLTQQNIAHFQPYRRGTIEFRVRAQNTCGWSAWKNQSIVISDPCDDSIDDVFDGPFIAGPPVAGSPGLRSANTTDENAAATIVNERLVDEDYFTIYPNPTSTVINLELKDWANMPSEDAKTTLEVYDVLGSLKLSQRVANNSARIDVSAFAKGAYFVRVNTNGAVETHKVIVQ